MTVREPVKSIQWDVTSDSHAGICWRVSLHPDDFLCSCPDFTLRRLHDGRLCKHQVAVIQDYFDRDAIARVLRTAV